MFSPILVTVAVFFLMAANSLDLLPLREGGLCLFPMNLGGLVTASTGHYGISRLGQKRPCCFCLGHLTQLLLWCSLWDSSARAERSPGNMRRPCVGVLADPPAEHSLHVIPGRTPGIWVKQPPNDSSPPMVKVTPNPLRNHISWDPRHHGAETNYLHCALSELLTNTMRETIQKLLFLPLSWGSLLHSWSNQSSCPPSAFTKYLCYKDLLEGG